LRFREDARPLGVVQNRGTSQSYRLERVVGRSIIAPRRTRSAHLDRPWRATAEYAIAASRRRFCASSPTRFSEHGVADRAKLDPGPATAEQLCLGAGRRQADGLGRTVVMAGLADSGRAAGQGNIDPNGPEQIRGYIPDRGARWRLRACRPRFVSMPRFAASVSAVPGRAPAVTLTNISMRRRTAGGK
jgi:hypothetical protein